MAYMIVWTSIIKAQPRICTYIEVGLYNHTKFFLGLDKEVS